MPRPRLPRALEHRLVTVDAHVVAVAYVGHEVTRAAAEVADRPWTQHLRGSSMDLPLGIRGRPVAGFPGRLEDGAYQPTAVQYQTVFGTATVVPSGARPPETLAPTAVALTAAALGMR